MCACLSVCLSDIFYESFFKLISHFALFSFLGSQDSQDCSDSRDSNDTQGSNEDLPNARVKVAAIIAQLICSNSVKRSSKGIRLYQSKFRETPVTLYNGLKLHVTRNKDSVKKQHSLGLSVSHDRVMDVRKQFARTVTKFWSQAGVVIPPSVPRKIFVTCSTDNCDISGRYEYHGTLYTITAHVTQDNPGECPPPLNFKDGLEDTEIRIPDEYSNVPYIEDYCENVKLPSITNGITRKNLSKDSQCESPDQQWVKHACDVIANDKLDEIPITWSGYHSYQQELHHIRPKASIGLFPEFYEKAATMHMQKHGMKMMMKATEYANPGQIPVLVADGPLYILLKKLQWAYPDEVGESKLVVFQGMLHLEMAVQECGGKLMGGSGWEEMFLEAGIFQSGVCNSLTGGKHVKRTRSSYEVTLVWLEVMKDRAYSEYINTCPTPLSKDCWDKQMEGQYPTAKFWNTVQGFLLSYFQFIRGQRTGNWKLTLSAIDDFLVWFFSFDRVTYSRMTPVFLRDMALLPEKHPTVHQAFMQGLFTVQRSQTKFSSMALDQSQEHSVKHVKEEGGGRGQYQNKAEKELLEISRPEVLRVVQEFENAASSDDAEAKIEHPESSIYHQKKLMRNVKCLIEAVDQKRIANPYLEQHDDLISITTGEIADPVITQSIGNIRSVGKRQSDGFIQDVIENGSKAITDTIKRNNLYTFTNRPSADLKKKPHKRVNNPTALVTRYYLSIKDRPDCERDDFFKHEIVSEPPTLSKNGQLYTGTKSTLLKCLPCMPEASKNPRRKEATVVLLDMAAVVHMVKPGNKTDTFKDYLSMNLFPFMERQLTPTVTRVDCIWDTYQEGSLKSGTRAKRGGTTLRQKVADNIRIPKGKAWQKFLNDEENKNRLFQFLSDQLRSLTLDKRYQIVTTKLGFVLSNVECDLSELQPCSQEEADTRLMLHLKHAADCSHNVAYMRTVDTDVVVLGVHFFPKTSLRELWIGFGSGKSYKDIPVHDICDALGQARCEAMPLFHALTGCDISSAIFNMGKQKAWSAWSDIGDKLTDSFIKLQSDPAHVDIDSAEMKDIEKFVIKQFNCDATSVNEARKKMFEFDQKSVEHIPPTQHALFQHVKRSLIASHIWTQSFTKQPIHLSPADYGWVWNDRMKMWMPHWSDLPEVSEGCAFLIRCKCSVGCSGRCKCHKNGMRCTSLCNCQGMCLNNE